MAAPGAGSYAAYSAAEAMVKRVVADGGTDTDQSLPASVATVLGVTNRGEVLANLQAAGATADSIPAAVNDLLGVENDWGMEDALRSLAEEYTAP